MIGGAGRGPGRCYCLEDPADFIAGKVPSGPKLFSYRSDRLPVLPNDLVRTGLEPAEMTLDTCPHCKVAAHRLQHIVVGYEVG